MIQKRLIRFSLILLRYVHRFRRYKKQNFFFINITLLDPISLACQKKSQEKNIFLREKSSQVFKEPSIVFCPHVFSDTYTSRLDSIYHFTLKLSINADSNVSLRQHRLRHMPFIFLSSPFLLPFFRFQCAIPCCRFNIMRQNSLWLDTHTVWKRFHAFLSCLADLLSNWLNDCLIHKNSFLLNRIIYKFQSE